MILAAPAPGPTTFDIWAYLVLPALGVVATLVIAIVSLVISRSAAHTARDAATLAADTAAAEQRRAHREERIVIGAAAQEWVDRAYNVPWLVPVRPKPNFESAERHLNEVMTAAEQHDDAVALSDEFHDLFKPVMQWSMHGRRNHSPMTSGAYVLATEAVSRWIGDPKNLGPVGKTGEDLERYLHQVGHYRPAGDHHPDAGYEIPEPLEE